MLIVKLVYLISVFIQKNDYYIVLVIMCVTTKLKLVIGISIYVIWIKSFFFVLLNQLCNKYGSKVLV